MRRLVVLLVFGIACFSGYRYWSFATAPRTTVETPDDVAEKFIFGVSEEQNGCCAWRGGRCGCEGEQVRCCDGTVSPSCRCRPGALE